MVFLPPVARGDNKTFSRPSLCVGVQYSKVVAVAGAKYTLSFQIFVDESPRPEPRCRGGNEGILKSKFRFSSVPGLTPYEGPDQDQHSYDMEGLKSHGGAWYQSHKEYMNTL